MTPPEINISETCIGCQTCCKTIGIPTNLPYTTQYIEFYSTRGFECFADDANQLILYKDIPCPYITPSGCLIYDDRPQVCLEYDGRLDVGPKPLDCALL